ncbi:UTRA domain-containing protein, partial [Streptomyces clavuligerus]
WTLSARDRLARVQRVKSFLAEGETSRVTAAELVVPPLYVAEIFDLDPGDQVVRREWLAGRGRTRTVFAVTWYPAPFAVLVPELLSTAPGKNHGITARVLEATGRRITHARDDIHAREADAREAGALGLPVGSPIFAGAHRWSDTEGVVEYGEWCLPPRFTIGYEYQP